MLVFRDAAPDVADIIAECFLVRKFLDVVRGTAHVQKDLKNTERQYLSILDAPFSVTSPFIEIGMGSWKIADRNVSFDLSSCYPFHQKL